MGLFVGKAGHFWSFFCNIVPSYFFIDIMCPRRGKPALISSGTGKVRGNQPLLHGELHQAGQAAKLLQLSLVPVPAAGFVVLSLFCHDVGNHACGPIHNNRVSNASRTFWSKPARLSSLYGIRALRAVATNGRNAADAFSSSTSKVTSVSPASVNQP